MSNKEQVKNVALAAAVVLLILSLVGNAVFMNQKRELKESVNRELLKQDSVLAVKMMLDKELDDARAELDKYKGQNAQLDKMLTEARMELDGKEQRIKVLISQNATVKKLRAQLAELMKLRQQQQAQIDKLLAENKSLRNDLANTQQERDDLKSRNDDLNKKLVQAGQLNAQSISVQFVRERGDRVKQTLKVNRANHILVNVDIAANPLSNPGSRKVFLLIYGPNGQVLSPQQDMFVNKQNGQESKYTMGKTIDYTNSAQKIRFDYDAGQRLEKGNYKFEVYVDGAYSGKYDFAMN